MKDPRIVALRNRAERDHGISDGALRLLLALLTKFGREKKAWTCTNAEALELCGISDRKTLLRRFACLIQAGYLVKAGAAGCPPKNLYFWP